MWLDLGARTPYNISSPVYTVYKVYILGIHINPGPGAKLLRCARAKFIGSVVSQFCQSLSACGLILEWRSVVSQFCQSLSA